MRYYLVIHFSHDNYVINLLSNSLQLVHVKTCETAHLVCLSNTAHKTIVYRISDDYFYQFLKSIEEVYSCGSQDVASNLSL